MVRRPSPTPRRRSVFIDRLAKSTGEGESPRVLDDLHAAILRGQQPPGTGIPIDAVAEFFGVSQIPVREALKTLIGEGLVQHVPRVGYSVAMLTFAEFRELYEVRRALETAAVRIAISRADEGARDRVRLAVTRMQDRRPGVGEHPDTDEPSRAFHLALLRPAGMPRLLHMYESAWNVTEPVQPMSRVDESARELCMGDHERMAAAFLSADADRMVAECETHYRHLLDTMAALADDPRLFRPET